MHYTQGTKQWAMTQIDREHFIALTNCPTAQNILRNTNVFIKKKFWNIVFVYL